MSSVIYPTPQADPQAEELIKRFNKMKSGRTNWDKYWDEIAEHFVPRKSNVYGTYVSGQKKENRLFDSESVHAVELLASALHGMLTNPFLVWFGLATSDEKLNADPKIRKWLQYAVNKMTLTLNSSNFQTEIHELFVDLVSFGTGKIAIDEDDDTIVRFSSAPIYDAYIEENNKGIVDTCFTESDWTIRQIIQEFGEKVIQEKCPDLLQKMKNDPEACEKILHCVFPRNEASKSRVPKKMAYASFHVFPRTKQILRESGYRMNRYAIPRWTKLSNEKYGRSPAMKCLSDVKTLNTMVRSLLQGSQLRAAPPVQAPDDGLMSPVRMTPHGVTFYRSGTKDRVEMMNIGGDLGINEKLVQMYQEKINKAFFINQLQLSENNPQMTATEVNQRTEDKLRLLGPILGRLHNELLKPIIDRVFEIMLSKGVFKDIPAELSGKKLEISYTSQIAKAQKASQLDSLPRLIQSVGPVTQMFPEMWDNVDPDGLFRYIADKVELPEEVMTDPVKRDQARRQKAQKQAEIEALAKQQHDAEVSAKVAPNMLKAQELNQQAANG